MVRMAILFRFIPLIKEKKKMHELIEIIENESTRFVKLKNVNTCAVEKCFDDSAVVSSNNFDFMRIGQQYECKIKLFGTPVDELRDNCVICWLVDKNIIIGQKAMVEVKVNNNIYYIIRQKVKDYLNDDFFYFKFTRKDLIQVNDIIHADLL